MGRPGQRHVLCGLSIKYWSVDERALADDNSSWSKSCSFWFFILPNRSDSKDSLVIVIIDWLRGQKKLNYLAIVYCPWFSKLGYLQSPRVLCMWGILPSLICLFVMEPLGIWSFKTVVSFLCLGNFGNAVLVYFFLCQKSPLKKKTVGLCFRMG